jgi:ubiquinone/menaquinone biosynthesis C-methylase UbiE
MSDLDSLRLLYAGTAALYEQRVIPAFAPLAYDLAGWVVRCANAWLQGDVFDPFDLDSPETANTQLLKHITAVDLGTGTGILARALSPSVARVIGVDLSPAMLRVAARTKAANNRHVVADLHHLPFRRGDMELIVSSFGLNASTPKEAFRSISGVLRSGMLAFQEWGAEDDCSRLVDEALKEYAPEEIPGMDETLCAYYARSKPWYDQLQYAEDFYELLKRMGFEMVWVKEAPFVTAHLPTLDTFLAYKLVWPQRRLALEAISYEQRAAFYADVRNRLQPYLNPEGSLDWSPPLFRVFAAR